MKFEPPPVPRKSNGIAATVVGAGLIVLAAIFMPVGDLPNAAFHVRSVIGLILFLLGAGVIRRRYQTSSKNLLLFVSACVIGLSIVEITLTIMGVPPLKRIVWHMPDQVPWWGPNANGQVRFIPEKYDGPWTINPQGFPDSDDFDKPVSVGRRVILLGDSFAYGASASSPAKSFAELLDAAPDTMVWNLGIPGTGQQEQLELLTDAPYDAQVIIATLYRNDFLDNTLPPWRFYVFADGQWVDRYEADGHGGFKELTPAQAYRRAFSVQKLRDLPKASRTASAVANLIRRTLNVERERRLDDPLPGYERTKNLVQALQSRAKARNARFILLLIPDRADTAMVSRPYMESRQLCDQLGITCIDALVDLKGFDYAPAPDTHWNDSGHAKIAALLLRELDQLKLK